MNKILLDTLPIWTTAQAQKTSGRGIKANNQQLFGIKKLRELILELAVRGKLVPQDSNDEPASELLKKIVEENKKKFKNEKKKDFESFREINEIEKILNLPVGWAWVRFGNISLIERGGSPRPIESFLTQDIDGYNWIKISDTEIGGKYITSTREKIRKEGLVKTRMVYPGDFLLTNSMSFGRPYITKIEGCIHDGWLRIHPPKELNKDYLYSLLSSPYVSTFFKIAAAGAVVLNLNADKVRELPIPLPPLAEQHRIVAKVDELMALCDELGKEQTNSNTAHETLVEILLTTLTNAKSTDDFKEAWERIAACFDTLFTTEHSIDKLKQTILQLAVMGKLVPQDPNDEPANELLKKIAKEKAQLVKEGKIKKQATLPEITDEEKPFELPKGWEWVRFGDLINIKSELVNSLDYPELDQVAPDSIEKNTGNLLFRRTVAESGFRGPNNRFYKGQILYSKIRPSLSKAIIATFDGVCSADMYPLESMINSEFLLKEILSEEFLKQVRIVENRIKMPKLNALTLSCIIVSLPPLAEQQRIVSKVDVLFSLCDSLKERIRTAQEIQNVLAEEIVRRVVK